MQALTSIPGTACRRASFLAHDDELVQRKLDEEAGGHADHLGEDGAWPGPDGGIQRLDEDRGQPGDEQVHADHRYGVHDEAGQPAVGGLERQVALDEEVHQLCQGIGDRQRKEGAQAAFGGTVVEQPPGKRDGLIGYQQHVIEQREGPDLGERGDDAQRGELYELPQVGMGGGELVEHLRSPPTERPV